MRRTRTLDGENVREKVRMMLEEKLDHRVGRASLLIIGDENCPNCGALKDVLSEELELGEAKYYDADSVVGRFWIKTFDIDYIPFVIYKDKETGRAYRVDVKDEGEEISLEVTDESR